MGIPVAISLTFSVFQMNVTDHESHMYMTLANERFSAFSDYELAVHAKGVVAQYYLH